MCPFFGYGSVLLDATGHLGHGIAADAFVAIKAFAISTAEARMVFSFVMVLILGC
jgi:hypothetical protein